MHINTVYELPTALSLLAYVHEWTQDMDRELNILNVCDSSTKTASNYNTLANLHTL
jgi:hypothetical protein